MENASPPPRPEEDFVLQVKNKPFIVKYIFFILFILLVVAGVLAYLLYTADKLPLDSKNIDSSMFPYEKISPPNILYPDSPSPDGRDLYYQSNNDGGNLYYSGVGTFKVSAGALIRDDKGETLANVSSGSNMTNYIVGSFVAWEDIPGSPDKIIVLEDKLKTIDRDKNISKEYPRIRIGFSTKDINYQTTFGTALGVEDLDSVIPETKDKVNGVATYKLGLIGDYTFEDLAKIIKPGDAISLRLQIDTAKQSDYFIDNSNSKLASWIFIRRFDPKTSLTQSLGRSVELIK